MSVLNIYKADEEVEKYGDSVVDYINREKDNIIKAASRVGMPKIANAIAGAMAEENAGYDYFFDSVLDGYALSVLTCTDLASITPVALAGGWTGTMLGILNEAVLMNTTSRSHEEWKYLYSTLAEDKKPDHYEKIVNPVLIDVGKANIKIHTAIRLLTDASLEHEVRTLQLMDYRENYQQLVEHLVNDNIGLSARIYALMMVEAERWFTDHNAYGNDWSSLPQAIKDALYITYTNIGKSGMDKAFARSTNGERLDYTPLPAAETGGGLNHLNNAEDVADAIGSSEYENVELVDSIHDWPNIAKQENDEAAAYREALLKLYPFVIKDGVYNEIALDRGNFSDSYLRDRAEMLSWHVRLRYDGVYPDQFNTFFFDGTGSSYLFEDVDSDLKVRLGRGEHVYIGFGNDLANTLVGEEGDDRLYGMTGQDALSGAGGNDYLEGGKGRDNLFGGDGDDDFFIMGEDADYDVFAGGDGLDTIQGSAGDDTIRVHQFSETHSIERISGGGGVDIIAGTDLADTVDLTPVAEISGIARIEGGAGEDVIKGSGIADIIYGGSLENPEDSARDRLEGGAGDDSYHVGRGDIVSDSDGRGTIWYDGRQLSPLVLTRLDMSDLYFDENTDTAAVIDRATGTLTLYSGDDLEFSIENFTSGSLGIVLQDDQADERSYTWTLAGSGVTDMVSQGMFEVDGVGGWGFEQRVWVDRNANFRRDGDEKLIDFFRQPLSVGTDSFLITGSGGNDYLQGFRGHDRLEGGEGDDRLAGWGEWLYSDPAFNDTGNTLDGGPGNDSLWGAAGADWLIGGEGDDLVSGVLGRDILLGDGGNDVLGGGSDSDLLAGGEGQDVLVGDAVIYSESAWMMPEETYGVSFTYFANGAISSYIPVNFIAASHESGLLPPQVRGGNDILDGGGGRDWIDGGAGNDILRGGVGEDTVIGGPGSDRLWGEDGNDVLIGDETGTGTGAGGGDFLAGGDGDDELQGQGGEDRLFGEAGNDRLFGGSSSDELAGGSGDDQLHGDDGDDILTGGTGEDILSGGAGNDRYLLPGGSGVDRVFDTEGSDTLIFDGTAAIEVTFGSVGAGGEVLHDPDARDLVIRYGQSDIVVIGNGRNGGWTFRVGGTAYDYTAFLNLVPMFCSYGSGSDVLAGSDNADRIYAGDGNDTVHGGGGNDSITGGNGFEPAFRDFLRRIEFLEKNGIQAGGLAIDGTSSERHARDTIYGDAGNDALSGGRGDDYLDGGDGADALHGGSDNDYLLGGPGNDILDGDVGDDTLGGGDGNDTLYGGDGGDVLSGDAGSDRLYGGAGDDSLSGGTGDDILAGGDGDDAFYGDEGADTVDGGPGRDRIDYCDSSAGILINLQTGVGTGGDAEGDVLINMEDVLGTPYSDVLVGNEGDNLLRGLGGREFNGESDTIRGGGGVDEIHGVGLLDGGAGNDMVYGSGFLLGGGGNDQLIARSQWSYRTRNELDGGAGDDVLTGHNGHDLLRGGEGDDLISGGSSAEYGYEPLSFDLMEGGAGNDTYLCMNSGMDFVNDNQGSNTIRLSGGWGQVPAPSDMRFMLISVDLDQLGTMMSCVGTWDNEEEIAILETYRMQILGGEESDSSAADDLLLDDGENALVIIGGGSDLGYTFEFGENGYTLSHREVLQFVHTVNNSLPTAESEQTYEMFDNRQLFGRIEVTDRDDDTLGFSIREQPLGGDFALESDGRWIYTAREDFTGRDNAVIDIDDGHGETVQVLLTFHVGSSLLPGSAMTGAGSGIGQENNGTEGYDAVFGSTGSGVVEGISGGEVLAGGLSDSILIGGSDGDTFGYDTAPKSSNTGDSIADFISGLDRMQPDSRIFSLVAEDGVLGEAFCRSATMGIAEEENDYFLYSTTSGGLRYDAGGSGQGVAVDFASLMNKPAVTAGDFLAAA